MHNNLLWGIHKTMASSLFLVVFCLVITRAEEHGKADTGNGLQEAIIDSHVYREPGCPLVPERRGFNTTQVKR